MDTVILGKFISSLRKEKGLKQSQLAEILGVSENTISKWERGINAPDISILNDLSKALGVSTNELLNCKKDINNKNYPIKKIVIGIIVCLFILIFIIIKNNNKMIFYNLQSNNENILVNGFIKKGKTNDTLSIKLSTDNYKDITINSFEYYLYIGNKEILHRSNDTKYIYNEKDSLDLSNEYNNLYEIINDIYIYINDDKDYSNTFIKDINKKEIKLIIKYLNNNKTLEEIIIPISISSIET